VLGLRRLAVTGRYDADSGRTDLRKGGSGAEEISTQAATLRLTIACSCVGMYFGLNLSVSVLA
jgi:uncharacterized membrane protein YjjP (DUF1212 family)